MKILQVINSFGTQSGGAERLAYQLHLDLMALGIDAHILALEACDTSTVSNSTSLQCRSSYDPAVLPRLISFLRKQPKPFDVIHGHLFPTSVLLSLCRRLGVFKVPLHFTEHSTHNKRRGTALGGMIDKFAYRRIDRIHCISPATEEALVHHYPMIELKADVITNGALLRFDAPVERVERTPVNILSIGGLRKPKNYENSLKAIEQLAPGTCEYTVLGDGPDREKLEDQAKRSTNPVTFAGHIGDPTPYLEKADIFLIPSLWEGFGLAAVEAMNASLPVIASNVTGLKDVVGTDGECAMLVDPDDVTGIRAAIEILANNSELRYSMGKAGFERAKKLDRHHMTQQYLAAYRAALET